MKYFNALINIYAKAQIKETTEEAYEMAKEAFKTLILSEIKEEYAKSIREQIKREVENEYKIKQQQEKIIKIKNLLIEGVLIATFVGLMVNQATDLITYMKNGHQAIGYITIFLVVLFISILCGYIKFIYMDKVTIFLEEYLRKK